MQNPDIFPFYTYGTYVKLRTFQNYVLFKNTYFQKFCIFKNTYFQKFCIFKNTYFQKFCIFKITYFQKYVLFTEFRTFQKIPHSKVRPEFPVFPTKIPCFSKIPRSKKVDSTQNSVFFQKNSVFFEIPRF